MTHAGDFGELNTAQRSLLEELLRQEGLAAPSEPLIPRRTTNENLPLSCAQQRLWLLDQLEPGNPAYNISKFDRFSGRLDVSALERSLSEIVRRHETLRTTFRSRDGEPSQVIVSPTPPFLSITDLSELAPAERERRARELAMLDGQRGFDLKVDLPFRAQLLKLGEEDHAFLLTMHHISSDGWSLSLFLAELGQLYEAFSNDKPSPLPELPIQYADYALWENERLKGNVLDAHLNYWRQQLQGTPGLLELPTDRPRPSTQSYRGAYVWLTLSEELSVAIKRLSLQEKATPFMTLLAAFKVLLYRLTGQDDVIVGAPVAGRDFTSLEPLIGCFLNMLALRTSLSGNPSFRDAVKLVRDTCLDAYSHQELPFERVIEELQLERQVSHAPVFQVLFNMHNYSEVEFQLPGLSTQSLCPPETPSKFDLTLYAKEHFSRIHFKLVYNTELFEQIRAQELLAQLELLLSQIVKNPAGAIDSFSLVTQRFEQFLPDPGQAFTTTSQATVHEIVSQHAQRTPDAVAVADPFESWTYAELDRHSNRLANCLIEHGIQPHDVVAIFGHRSASFVSAMLGVLKAGAAFLILDPNYPGSRLTEYVRIAKPRGWLHIVAAGEPPDDLREFIAQHDIRCHLEIGLKSSSKVEDYPADAPQVHVSSTGLAYVTFTSGTTGVPRGIGGTHDSLTHYPTWLKQTFGIDNSDRFSMLSGLSHDPLLRDVFSPLQLGAMLCVPDQDDIETPGKLAIWMNQQNISVTNLTPAMGHILSGDPSDAKPELRSLRHAFFVGEPLMTHDVSRLKELAPSATCVNLYGTTETQRSLSYYVVPEAETNTEPSSKAVLPVGVGITNVQLLILNRSQRPAGCGELGEIYFRSPHIARRYLNDEALTKKHFLINPFTGDPADWIYRTGDLGRYLPDGAAEMLGRADDQVKIRGFRVEPGEVETVVKAAAGVTDCRVIQRPGKDGVNRLVAYVVLTPESSTTANDLRSQLKQQIPSYMLPSAFVFLEKIPLTPNGKVDQRALPDDVIDGPASSDNDYAAPPTPIEEALMGIWSRVLGVENIGLHDDFFALGGHSLVAMRMLSQTREMLHALHFDVPLRTLFEASTISEFAQRIEQAIQAGQQSHAVRVERTPRNGQIPLSLVQEGWLLREWWENVHSVEKRSFHSVATLGLDGPLDLSILEQAINEIIRRHEVLRSTFTNSGGLLAQRRLFPVFRKIFAIGGVQNKLYKLNNKVSQKQAPAFLGPSVKIKPLLTLPLRLVDLQQLDAETKSARTVQIVREELQTHFDYAHGPLLRATVMRLAPEEHVLTIVVHHLVSDGWSMQVLLRELAVLYACFSSGAKSPLPELPFQYVDFAAWQRKWFQGEILQSTIDYWREQFRGVGLFPELTLPFTKKDPPPDFQRSVEVQSLTLPPELSKSLVEFGYRQGVTMYMLFLAALKALLHRYTGREKISVFTPLANRSRTETQGLIGWFANVHAVSTRCSGNPRFSDFLKQIREVALGAYAHQEVPYLLLVKVLLPEMKNYELPQRVFEVPYVLFDFTVQKRASQKFFDLTTKPIEIPPSSADAGVEVKVIEGRDDFKLTIKYSTEFVYASNIRRMLDELRMFLETVVNDPEIKLLDLPMESM